MQSFCNPAIVYMIGEIFANIYYLITTGSFGIIMTLMKFIFIYLWVLILQYFYLTLCWRTFSWIIVIIPIVLQWAAVYRHLVNTQQLPKTTTPPTTTTPATTPATITPIPAGPGRASSQGRKSKWG